MANISGSYKLDYSENYEEYLRALGKYIQVVLFRNGQRFNLWLCLLKCIIFFHVKGVDEAKIKQAASVKPDIEIAFNGSKYYQLVNTPTTATNLICYIGEEYDHKEMETGKKIKVVD